MHARALACTIAAAIALFLLQLGVAAPASAAADPMPVGGVVAWGGSSIPAGYLLADGSAVSRATYPTLFAAIGTTWGAGDGSTTFNLPDLRGSTPLGTNAAGTAPFTAGTRGGTLDHSPGLAAHAHSVASDGGHAHSDAGHSHVSIAPFGETSGNVTIIHPGDSFLDALGASVDIYTVVGSFLGAHPYSTNVAWNTERHYMASTGAEQATAAAGAHTHGGTGSTSATTSTANAPFLSTRYLVKATANAPAPCGALWHAASGSPAGTSLLANGAAVGRATQSSLFACTGTAFGAGDGSTTFNVPDLRGRLALGTTTSGTGSTFGASGGAFDHAHSVSSHAHSIAAQAAHAHDDTHTHSFTDAVGVSSNMITFPRPGDSVRDHVGSWNFLDVGPATQWYAHTPNFFGNPVEVWAHRTTAVAPAVSSNGSHGHGANTGSAGTTSGAANPPYLAAEPYIARTDGELPGAGALMPFAGASVPTGWLVADGTAVSRATYDKLFAEIGTTYGAGNGSTTFNLPNLVGRHALGRSASIPAADTVGETGGSQSHTHSANHSHSISSDGNHSHSIGSHQHQFSWPVGNSGAGNLAVFMPWDASQQIFGSTYVQSVQTSDAQQCCTNPTWFGAMELYVSTTSAASSSTNAAGTHAHGGATGTGPFSTNASTTPYAAMRYLVRLNSAPLAPTLASPANGATVSDTPTLSATYLDGDAAGTDAATIDFQVCSDVACTSVLESGSSAAGIAIGANGSWVVPSSLGSGTFHWRARAVDDEGEIGPWSATRSFSSLVMSISLSTIGHADTVRDTSSPYTINLGAIPPGTFRDLGPAGSGQALPGAAVIASVAAGTNHELHVSAAAFTSGANTIPAANFQRRHFGTAEAWSPWPTTATSLEGVLSSGSRSFSYDMRLAVPAGQPNGAYSTSMTWTVIAVP